LPAGFGSGWDNFRGTPGHINVSRPSVAGDMRERDGRRRQLLAALQRQPMEPCRLPNMVHCGAGGVSGAPSLESHAGALRGSSASVTAFSPNGMLLAVAVEEAPKQWAVKVCTSGKRAIKQTSYSHAACSPAGLHVHWAVIYCCLSRSCSPPAVGCMQAPFHASIFCPLLFLQTMICTPMLLTVCAIHRWIHFLNALMFDGLTFFPWFPHSWIWCELGSLCCAIQRTLTASCTLQL
jgi:hypothetical protein